MDQSDETRKLLHRLYPGDRLSSGQAALLLGCSLSHVKRIPREDLHYVLVGNRRRYLVRDVEQFMKDRGY